MTDATATREISVSGDQRPGFDRKMTKPEIAALPMRAFPGTVMLVNRPEQINQAIELLEDETVLGFDTETRPAYRKGEVYPTALIQLCGAKGACVFQILQTGLPDPLVDILADSNIVKAGIAPGRDVDDLTAKREFTPAGFIDLSRISYRNRMKNHGLRGLAGVLLGFRISKKMQRSNWGRQNLSPEQILYAATDAWIGREIYLAMQKLNYI